MDRKRAKPETQKSLLENVVMAMNPGSLGPPGQGPRYATRGMVTSISPAAAVAGLNVLLKGGNAFDADEPRLALFVRRSTRRYSQ